MPVHDWTRVDAGLFHAFHQGWVCALSGAFNSGGLPTEYYALIERSIPGIAPLGIPEAEIYAHKADRIAVRHRQDQLVAVIEIVSPGNKGNNELRTFVEKSADLIRHNIHLLVIDLFPPGPHDPQGIHKAIWAEFSEEDFQLPLDKPLTLVAYEAGQSKTAYPVPAGVGDVLPSMPLFLKPECYVLAPLEATYQTTWHAFPAPLKGLLERPATGSSEGS